MGDFQKNSNPLLGTGQDNWIAKQKKEDYSFPEKKWLSIETHGPILSVGLFCHGIFTVFERENQGLNSQHAAFLLPMIESILDKNSLRFEELDGVCTVRGPGSFTGIRIGLAVLQMIALTYPHLSIISITLFDLLARAYKHKDRSPFLIILPNQNDTFYSCLYNKDGYPEELPTLRNERDIIPLREKAEIVDEKFLPSPLAYQLLEYALTSPKSYQASSLEPLYIKTPEYKKRSCF